jgi:hypothetical protein
MNGDRGERGSMSRSNFTPFQLLVLFFRVPRLADSVRAIMVFPVSSIRTGSAGWLFALMVCAASCGGAASCPRAAGEEGRTRTECSPKSGQACAPAPSAPDAKDHYADPFILALPYFATPPDGNSACDGDAAGGCRHEVLLVSCILNDSSDNWVLRQVVADRVCQQGSNCWLLCTDTATISIRKNSLEGGLAQAAEINLGAYEALPWFHERIPFQLQPKLDGFRAVYLTNIEADMTVAYSDSPCHALSSGIVSAVVLPMHEDSVGVGTAVEPHLDRATADAILKQSGSTGLHACARP